MASLSLLRESPLSARIGMAMILINIFAAILAPAVAPYGETEIVGDVWETSRTFCRSILSHFFSQ